MRRMNDTPYSRISQALQSGGPEAALAAAAAAVSASDRPHELFDVRLMQARLKLGLPVGDATPLDDLAEPVRTAMEDAYLEACREVGHLLLSAGRLRESWMYLRPVGDKEPVARKLEELAANSDDTQAVLELALHEGLHPRLGFELVLKQYGLCNAISMYDGAMHARAPAERKAVARLLVDTITADLTRSIQAAIERKEGACPSGSTISQLVSDRPWLFENDDYHVDTSHLGAIVRFALVFEDREDLEKAWNLTEYGRRLSPHYQYPGSEPFAETYAAHGLFYAASLGRQVEEALEYFGQRAQSLADTESAAAAADAYVALLVRVGRLRDAFDAASRLMPPGQRGLGLAPSLLVLAQKAAALDCLVELTRDRGDVVGYVTALVEQASP